MGGAVWTLPGTDVDYRGAHLTHHEVPAVSIAALLQAPGLTDLLHIDVQGVEFDLVEPASDAIQCRRPAHGHRNHRPPHRGPAADAPAVPRLGPGDRHSLPRRVHA